MLNLPYLWRVDVKYFSVSVTTEKNFFKPWNASLVAVLSVKSPAEEDARQTMEITTQSSFMLSLFVVRVRFGSFAEFGGVASQRACADSFNSQSSIEDCDDHYRKVTGLAGQPFHILLYHETTSKFFSINPIHHISCFIVYTHKINVSALIGGNRATRKVSQTCTII